MWSHSRPRNDDCMDAVPGIEVHQSVHGYAKIQSLGIVSSPYSDSSSHSSKLPFPHSSFQDSLSHRTSSLMEICSPNSSSDLGFGATNIHSVHIELCVHSHHCELSPLWESAVHGWVGVASHLAKSQSRICHLRVLLSCSSSFDRARTCRSNSRISKHRSKHTTRLISMQVRLLNGYVCAFMG